MTNEMVPYDQRAWSEVEQWRQSRLTSKASRVVPVRVRDRIAGTARVAKGRLGSLPGASEFEHVFTKALGGLLDLSATAARASVRQSAVVEGYRKRGFAVDSIEDIGLLDLVDIDRVKPHLGLSYTAAATVEGAAAGFAVSGGEIVAAGGSVFGAGVGAAPGIGTIVGVMAADAAAVIVAANRAVAHTAAYYGYDLKRPEEQVFALAVLSVGTAAQAGKASAYMELNKLVQLLARRATWEQLRRHGTTRIVEQVFARLGYRVTQRKLGQAVPVIGTVLGAGMNARLLGDVTSDANFIYRERFLRERYGLSPSTSPVAGEEDGFGAGDVIEVSEIVEAEVLEP
ncbi:EcsC family protein [Pedococcus sp. KACC 23699]|uniref:EcsC family protein n=1 Tax=Pedococcus sp. KACC 23699 TaxID=3149228 RepID=A0AAU7JY23_9MICO